MEGKNRLPPVHPGEIIKEDILPSVGLTVTAAAKALGVSRQMLHDILAERKPLSAVMCLKVSRLFGSTPEWRFVRDGREFRVTCTPRFTTNIADAAIQYAEADGGLTDVMAYQAADAIKAGRLKVVLAKFQRPALPIHIVYPTSRLLSAKVRAFVDLVVETSEWHFG